MMSERLHKSEKKVLSTIKAGPNVAFPLPLCNLTINLYTFYFSILMLFKQLQIFFTHWKTLKALQKVMNNHRPWNYNSTSFHKLKMLWAHVWVHTLRPVSVREILHCYCPLSLFFHFTSLQEVYIPLGLNILSVTYLMSCSVTEMSALQRQLSRNGASGHLALKV